MDKIFKNIGRGKISQKVINFEKSSENFKAFINLFLENETEIKKY